MPDSADCHSYLFVYGTLRTGFDGPMARWLRSVARLIGPATIGGRLYHVADYPGLVPGPVGLVRGDLYASPDMAAILLQLDEYEEITNDHPRPHEYRRDLSVVQATDGPVTAWVYAYSHDVTGLEPIAGGDFLACARPTGG